MTSNIILVLLLKEESFASTFTIILFFQPDLNDGFYCGEKKIWFIFEWSKPEVVFLVPFSYPPSLLLTWPVNTCCCRRLPAPSHACGASSPAPARPSSRRLDVRRLFFLHISQRWQFKIQTPHSLSSTTLFLLQHPVSDRGRGPRCVQELCKWPLLLPLGPRRGWSHNQYGVVQHLQGDVTFESVCATE